MFRPSPLPRCLALALLAALIFPAAGALGAGDPPEGAAERLRAMSQQLVALSARYRGAPSAVLRTELTALAAERAALMAELIAEDPATILQVALPERLVAGMPRAAQDHVEERLAIEGELEILVVDARDPRESRTLYFLYAPEFDERFQLHFAGRQPALLTGTPVRARGVVIFGASSEHDDLDGAMALEDAGTGLEVLAADGSGTATGTSATMAPELSNTLGEQGTAVLLVNFLDNLSEPWTIEEARDLVLATVSDAFFESSYHQTWLAGDVFGWFPLPINSTCSEVAIQAAADEAATNAGTDLSAYSRLVYIFPHMACFWSGLATVGGNPSRAFINGRVEVKVVGHELGHNLGLLHSNALDCGSVSLAENCDLRAYGDYPDMMGNRTSGHFNAFQKERLGWLGFGNSPSLDVVDLDGSYVLEPYEIEPGVAPAGVKVLRYVDPATGRGNWFYLEFRQALGFDDFLAGNTNLLNGVVVHKAVEGDARSSQLLDLTPESISSDFEDPALAVGESLFDAASGVTVTTDWADSHEAVVTVNFGDPVCAPADPEVAMLPAESQWVAPGTSVLFTITLTNHDNVACAAPPFDLDALVPPGWLAELADPSVTLLPGASATTTLEIVSPLAASDGFHDIKVTAANGDDPSYAASATAVYVVDTSVVNALPLAADDSATTVQETAVVLDVLANDIDPEGAPLQVTAATDGSNGAVIVNADDTVTYTPAARFKGTDAFQYTVSDGLNSAAATVTVAVEKRTGSGNGGGGKGKPS